MTFFTKVNSRFNGAPILWRKADSVAQGSNSGRLIADTIIPGAIKFVNKQPFVVMGSVDEQQNLWASILVGHHGFMTASLSPRLPLRDHVTHPMFFGGDEQP